MKNEPGHLGPLPDNWESLMKTLKDNPPIPVDKLHDVYGPGNDNYGRDKRALIEYEKCVSCGKETNAPTFLCIDARENYVEGAGQLCSECYNKMYNKLP
jgi:hypothetical protein